MNRFIVTTLAIFIFDRPRQAHVSIHINFGQRCGSFRVRVGAYGSEASLHIPATKIRFRGNLASDGFRDEEQVITENDLDPRISASSPASPAQRAEGCPCRRRMLH